MSVNHVIVQAGGRGSRLGRLTRNKPKALVPVENLPMVFHLFRAWPDAHFVIIGDYKIDVLERYLATFSDVDCELVDASGHTGTCAGVGPALAALPEGEPFLLLWCDLVLPEEHELPDGSENAIGISKDFECRWSYADGRFEESPSAEHGVAGYFVFRSKAELAGVPADGEFVRWLGRSGTAFGEEVALDGAREFGLLARLEELPVPKCRPFNRIDIRDGLLVKMPLDEQGRSLAKRESAWYERVADKGFRNIPKIYSTEPLTMELVDGVNLYDCGSLPAESKGEALSQIVDCLKGLHELGSAPFDKASYHDAYIGKTLKRLEKVRDLVPFAHDERVVVNGKPCRNVFFNQEALERAVGAYAPERFVLLHGDCTFSNMMLRPDGSPVLIDPRGYFGHTELYGDAAYDWAKLYYSLHSNYDQFNLKRFSLEIGEGGVAIEVESNGWEDLEERFFELVGDEVDRRQMKLLLAITWLSLTTYAWEDYDSICGAFYIGTYYLEEAFE